MYRVRSSDELLQHTGQGDAYVFNPLDLSVLNHSIMANKADAAAKQKALADRDAQLAEQLKYNPKAIHAPYQQEQQQKYDNLLKMKAGLLQNHVYDPSHPDRIAYENAKNELEQDWQKANDIMGTYKSTSDQIQKDPYLKQEQAQRAANDLLHDDSGVSRKPIREVNPQAIGQVVNDPQHFNLQTYSEDFAKETPENVRSYLHEERLLGGRRTNEDIVKSKFHVYDDDGNLVKDEKGNPVVNITPESKHLFFNKDPRARAAVDYEVKKQNDEISAYNSLPENKNSQKPLVTEDDVLRQYVSPYAYSNVNKNVGTLNKPNEGNTSTAYGSNPTSKFVAEPAVIQQKSATGLEHNIPGVELSYKDKPIDFQIAPKELIDLGGGKIQSNKDRVNIKASSLGYGLQTKSKKLVAFDSVDKMEEFINNLSPEDAKKYNMKQFLFGNITESEKTEGDTETHSADDALESLVNKTQSNSNRNRSVAIEYNPNGEAAARLQALSGGKFNNNRELTPDEQKVVSAWQNKQQQVQTIDTINKMYPNATPEEKAAIYKGLTD